MLPKVDLHCHLDGSLSETVVMRLARNAGVLLPDTAKALTKKLTAPADCKSLLQYLECFDLPVTCLQNEENLFEAAKSVIMEAAGEDVIYMEIRFAPLLHTAKGLNVKSVLRAVTGGVREGLRVVKSSGKVMEAGVIVCGMRHMSVDDNAAMLREAYGFYGDGLCGIDIAGGEADYPPMCQKAFFELAKDMGIPITIHAGECGSVQNVIDAVCLGAKRIGHGIALMKDKEARARIKAQGTVLELCPTSNLQTKAVESWEDYPFRMFMDEGLKITVNTDNRTVSQTTMTNEYRQLQIHCNMTGEDEKRILKNSIDAAFASDHVKKYLLQHVENLKKTENSDGQRAHQYKIK